jgi:hypothetical protein
MFCVLYCIIDLFYILDFSNQNKYNTVGTSISEKPSAHAFEGEENVNITDNCRDAFRGIT